MRLKKSYLIIAAVIILALVAGLVWWNYINSTFTITVNYSNTSSVTVYDTSQQHAGRDDIKITDVTDSGQTIRLKRGPSYSVIYHGATGYVDGQIPINEARPTITIDPDYNKEKYAAIMNESLPVASTVLQKEYPNVKNLYTIQSAGMKNKGEWYTIKLTHNGSYDYNTDSLRVLLRKTGDTWNITCKPSIIFTTKNCSDISADILKWSNELF